MPYEKEPFVERRIAVLIGVPGALIKDATILEDDLKRISRDRWGLTLVGASTNHQFTGDEDPLSPHEDGGTGVVIYAESHGAISSWPKLKVSSHSGHLEVDLTTCSIESILDEEFERTLLSTYRPQLLRSSLVKRGIWGTEEVRRQRIAITDQITPYPNLYTMTEINRCGPTPDDATMDNFLRLLAKLKVGSRLPGNEQDLTSRDVIELPPFEIPA